MLNVYFSPSCKIVAVIFGLLILTSCSNSENKDKVVEALLEVNQDRLDPEIMYSSDNKITYQIPKNFNGFVHEKIGNASAFIDESDSTIMIYSEPEQNHIVALSDSVRNNYLHVSESEFISNQLAVRQIVFQQPEIINFRLYFTAQDINKTYQVDYFIKPELLDNKIKLIESSIGSFKLNS